MGKHRGLDTAFVLRRLEVKENAGKACQEDLATRFKAPSSAGSTESSK
jgi:hypothetical protein